MNIVVTVKQVPDTWAEKKLDPSDKTIDRASVDNVMNEMDEYGVEEALRIKEAHGGEVTVLTMGPEKAVETIRKALSMGADKAVHLTDDALHGSDALQTSAALAKRIETLVARPGHHFRRGLRRPWRRHGRAARRAARPAAAHPRPQGHGRPGRQHGHHRAADRRRLRRGRGLAAGGGQRRREDQRAALPVVQGHHGRQEEAGDHAVARPTSASTPARSVSRTPAARWTTRSRGRRSRPVRSSRTRATAARSWPSSSPPRSSSEPARQTQIRKEHHG